MPRRIHRRHPSGPMSRSMVSLLFSRPGQSCSMRRARWSSWRCLPHAHPKPVVTPMRARAILHVEGSSLAVKPGKPQRGRTLRPETPSRPPGRKTSRPPSRVSRPPESAARSTHPKHVPDASQPEIRCDGDRWDARRSPRSPKSWPAIQPPRSGPSSTPSDTRSGPSTALRRGRPKGRRPSSSQSEKPRLVARPRPPSKMLWSTKRWPPPRGPMLARKPRRSPPRAGRGLRDLDLRGGR